MHTVSQISIQRVSSLIQRRYVISAITIRIISHAPHALLLEVTHIGEVPFLERTRPNTRFRASLSGAVVVGLLPCGRTKSKVSHSSFYIVKLVGSTTRLQCGQSRISSTCCRPHDERWPKTARVVLTVFHTSLSQRALVRRKGRCSHPDEIDIMSISDRPIFICNSKMKWYLSKKPNQRKRTRVHVPNGSQFFQEP